MYVAIPRKTNPRRRKYGLYLRKLNATEIPPNPRRTTTKGVKQQRDANKEEMIPLTNELLELFFDMKTN